MALCRLEAVPLVPANWGSLRSPWPPLQVHPPSQRHAEAHVAANKEKGHSLGQVAQAGHRGLGGRAHDGEDAVQLVQVILAREQRLTHLHAWAGGRVSRAGHASA